jgi:hypothetical protein
MASFGDVPFLITARVDIYDELRRFVKKVADYSNDPMLAYEAEELVVLYGNPDARPPKGVIKG